MIFSLLLQKRKRLETAIVEYIDYIRSDSLWDIIQLHWAVDAVNSLKVYNISPQTQRNHEWIPRMVVHC